MSSILAPRGDAGFIGDVDSLVKLIQKGDGMGWPGDPRMYVIVGVLEKKDRWGKVVATGRRYEVKRLGEDGAEHHIGNWRLEEYDQIIFDLTRLRVDAPGHVDSGLIVDAHNAKIEQDAAELYVGHGTEMMSHAMSIYSERTTGKHVFRQVGGSGPDIAPKMIVPDNCKMGD